MKSNSNQKNRAGRADRAPPQPGRGDSELTPGLKIMFVHDVSFCLCLYTIRPKPPPGSDRRVTAVWGVRAPGGCPACPACPVLKSEIFVHDVSFCLCLYTICRHRRTCRRPQLRPPSYCGRGSARPGGVPCLPCLPCFEEQRPIAAGARPTSRCDCPCTRLVAKRRRGEGWGRHEPRRSKQGGAGGAGGPGWQIGMLCAF